MSDPHFPHSRHSSIVIDLAALRDNYQLLKKHASGSKVIAVIKADAYGHGAVEVARALPDADALAVATVSEAVILREAGIRQKIVVLGGALTADEMQDCVQHQLDPVIHQPDHITWLSQLDSRASLQVWLKLNSGMGRLGFSIDQFPQAVVDTEKLASVDKVRLMTHLANADDSIDQTTQAQLNVVEALALRDYEWCIANSAGLLAWPDSHQHWTRSGIALYGSDPMTGGEFSETLQPVMTFRSSVLAVNALKKGQRVGYGGLHSCPVDSTIAVVAAGYADGYPRHLQGGFVSIKGHDMPVVGRVSMDMITVDVTGFDIKIGDEVIMWGRWPLAAEIAKRSETIAYELFCHAGRLGHKKFINQ